MDIKEFATSLDGKEYGYPLFSDEELKTAKENHFVIVTGTCDDIVEFNGAFGKFLVDTVPGGKIKAMIMDNDANEPNMYCLTAQWCKDIDENGGIIGWNYGTSFERETFMIYRDGELYGMGFVFCTDTMPKKKRMLIN